LLGRTLPRFYRKPSDKGGWIGLAVILVFLLVAVIVSIATEPPAHR
jgi:hypothetical protein